MERSVICLEIGKRMQRSTCQKDVSLNLDRHLRSKEPKTDAAEMSIASRCCSKPDFVVVCVNVGRRGSSLPRPQ